MQKQSQSVSGEPVQIHLQESPQCDSQKAEKKDVVNTYFIATASISVPKSAGNSELDERMRQAERTLNGLCSDG